MVPAGEPTEKTVFELADLLEEGDMVIDGVEKRGSYYDKAGALRDMIPNHLFQLLALTPMEAPTCFAADAVRDEKTKLFHAVQEIAPEQVANCERGFRFLKDTLFFTSTVFFNIPRRVAALAMVMGLCLLVYTIGQRQLRQALAHSAETIPNQLHKPTSTPTLRWVRECFQTVHLVYLNHQLQIFHLTDIRVRILRFLRNPCQKKYYLICYLPAKCP